MERIGKLLALAACTAVAFTFGSAGAEESKVTIVKASSLDAMKVVRDKDTGRLRAATSEEIVEMNAAGSRLPSSILTLARPTTTTVTHPDGSVTARRSLDDLDSVVATRGTDGKLVLRHGGTHAAPVTQPLPKE